MSGELHPDVIAAINQLSGTPLGRKYDRIMRAKYHKSGAAVAAKTVIGESGGRRNAVSSAGARGYTQFMPGTRQEYLDKYGVDAWGGPKSAIKAMMLYQTKGGGVESYNPGMPTYADYIMKTRIDPATNKALIRSGSKRAQQPDPDAVNVPGTPAVPGQSFAAERSDLRANLLLGGKLSMSKLLDYKQQSKQLVDTPGTPAVPGRTVSPKGAETAKPRTKVAQGKFNIIGPNPARLQPELVSYARKVARIYGGPLTGSDGSGHSKLTVNGNVSEHFSGNATDIPLTGKALVRAGQAALIAAGMPRAKAMKQNGGLYNVGNHQIIFNVDGKQYGGNHLDHLHISSHARR